MNLNAYLIHLKKNGIICTKEEIENVILNENRFFYFDGRTSCLAWYNNETLFVYALVKNELPEMYISKINDWLKTINIKEVQYMYNKKKTHTTTNHVNLFIKKVLL